MSLAFGEDDELKKKKKILSGTETEPEELDEDDQADLDDRLERKQLFGAKRAAFKRKIRSLNPLNKLKKSVKKKTARALAKKLFAGGG